MRRVFRLPFTHRRLRAEVDDELAFHLEARTQRLIAGGLSPDDARREALRQFGDLGAVRESCLTLDEQRERHVQRIDLIEQVVGDAAYAARTLARNKAFTAVVVIALGIGIGANTAIFTLIDAVLVRHLPVRHPEQLVAVGDPTRVNSFSQGTPRVDLLPLYRDVRRDNRVFTDVLASGKADRLDVRIDGTSGDFEHPRGRYVSGNYFAVLGVHAAVGRTFDSTADLVAGGTPEATISDGWWTRRFHRDPAVIGRTMLVDGIKIAIVGVAPPGFTGEIVGVAADVWLPLTMHDALRPNERILDSRAADWLLLLGRLAPGMTLERARRELETLVPREILAHSPPGTTLSAVNGPAMEVSSGSKGFSRVRMLFEAPLLTLMAGVALLLVIICANVANLMLARALARGREMAVRLALGANRARLLRQVLTESAVLAALGAAAGLLAAWWCSRLLLAVAASGTGMSLDVGTHAAVLWFTLGTSALTVLLFGLAPALRASRSDVAAALRGNTFSGATAGAALGARGQRAPLGRMLIVSQVALSVVLLVGAAMLVRSLRNLRGVNAGFDTAHVVVADIDIQVRGYAGAPLYALAHALRDRVAALPGVVAATCSDNGIFLGSNSDTFIEVPGFTPRAAADSSAAYDNACPAFAHAIGARLLAGRDLAPGDEGKPARVALVNEAFASFYFPHQPAVGQFFHITDSIAVQIIGVIGDVRDHALDEAARRRFYFPYAHTDTGSAQAGNPYGLRLLVRTAGDPAAMIQPVRAALLAVDLSLPINSIDAMPELLDVSIRQQRLVADLATAFGALALLLAAVGLYGVMTYAVTRRTGEIGLRVALGAGRGDVLRLVLLDAARLVGAGIALGLPLALLSMRLLRSQLHGVALADPPSIALAVGVLVLSALAAAFIPARRAAKVSPIVALRQE